MCTKTRNDAFLNTSCKMFIILMALVSCPHVSSNWILVIFIVNAVNNNRNNCPLRISEVTAKYRYENLIIIIRSHEIYRLSQEIIHIGVISIIQCLHFDIWLSKDTITCIRAYCMGKNYSYIIRVIHRQITQAERWRIICH